MSIVTLAQVRQELRQHRLECGLSLEQLAEAIGGPRRISAATLMRFMDGTTDPHETTEYSIRKYLERIAQKRSA